MQRTLRYIRYLMFAAVLTAVTGCRVNNGDIGLLYGIWVVTEVEVDGEEYDGWRTEEFPNTFFQFQNNICLISRVSDRYDTASNVCTWQWITEDTCIELSFTHHDDASPEPGSGMYAPPAWLLLYAPGDYRFDVAWDGEKKARWTTVNTDGRRITYSLRKTL